MLHIKPLFAISFLGLVISLGAMASDPANPEIPIPNSGTLPNELTESNFLQWRDHIQVSEAELSWQKLPWETSFHAGIAQAGKLNKPLLLWVMNGHPMGCT